MQLCNETITVFNTRMDEEKGYDVYIPTVINGVSWHCDIASNVDSTGLKAANKFTIRIPIDADFSGKAYAEPSVYAGGDPTYLFTLKNGDIIIKGAYDGTGLTLADIKAFAGDTVKVLGVTDNRRAPHGKHWKVVGS